MRDPKSTIYSPSFGRRRWWAKLSRLSRQMVFVGIAFLLGFGAVLVLPYAGQIRDFLRMPRKVVSIVTGIPRVLDGDTIEINGIHVRLDGIDAEEIAHGPGRPAERNGYAAKGIMQGIVGINASVRCELSGETTFDRQVGTCFNAANEDIGAELVKRGMALDCARFSGGRYRRLEPPGARQQLIQKPYCGSSWW